MKCCEWREETLSEVYRQSLYEFIPTLPPKQAVVAKFLLDRPVEGLAASVQELAAATGVNVATVIRLAKAMGFSGFHELKQQLRHRYLAGLHPSEVLAVHGGSRTADAKVAVKASLIQDQANLTEFVASIDLEQVQQSADLLARASRRLVVTSGSHAAVGLLLSHQATFMGYPTELENRAGSYLGQRLASMGPADLLIGVSFWRSSRSVVRSFEVARRYALPSLAISDSIYAPIAQLATLALIVPTESTTHCQSLVAPMALVDGIIAALAHHDQERTATAIRRAEQIYVEVDTYPADA
jgi:DNA-binding MurR/RpiR family transcriptional regulator